jgi:hypothetical protein
MHATANLPLAKSLAVTHPASPGIAAPIYQGLASVPLLPIVSVFLPLALTHLPIMSECAAAVANLTETNWVT